MNISEKKVQLILGFEEGTLPLKTSPIFIRKVEDVDRLIWNESCSLNLVNFIPKDVGGEKIGIILRNCEIKTFIVLLNENQLKRENFLIIGVPCQFGKLDIIKVQNAFEGKEILGYQLNEEKIILKGDNFVKSFLIKDLLLDSCTYCKAKIPSMPWFEEIKYAFVILSTISSSVQIPFVIKMSIKA